MLPEFALHHLPLYVTLACTSAGLIAWTWARIVTSRQERDDRREGIAARALRAAPTPEAVVEASGERVGMRRQRVR